MTVEFTKPAFFRQPILYRLEEVAEGWIRTEDKTPLSHTFGYAFNSECRDLETGIPIVFTVKFVSIPMNYGGFIKTKTFAKVEGAKVWEPLHYYSFWQPRLGNSTPHPFKAVS